MAAIEVASFNVFGIEGRSIEQSVSDALADLGGTGNQELLAVAFQEVWRRAQFREVRRAFLGPASKAQEPRRGSVDNWFCPTGGPWRCLAPRLPKVLVGNLELSSGLVLCVQGQVRDRFFQAYRGRGAAFPDNLSHKGILAVLLSHRQRLYAVVNTHMHDSKNDAFGGGRDHQVQQLANVLAWIQKHWRHAEVVVLGDFNIDSIEAVARTNKVTTTLYSRLLRAARAQGPGWFDANARTHRPPIRTTPGAESRALDHHLLSPIARELKSFATAHHGSDHLMTRSRWERG